MNQVLLLINELVSTLLFDRDRDEYYQLFKPTYGQRNDGISRSVYVLSLYLFGQQEIAGKIQDRKVLFLLWDLHIRRCGFH